MTNFVLPSHWPDWNYEVCCVSEPAPGSDFTFPHYYHTVHTWAQIQHWLPNILPENSYMDVFIHALQPPVAGVPDHDGGRQMEVNACILITHMVYL